MNNQAFKLLLNLLDEMYFFPKDIYQNKRDFFHKAAYSLANEIKDNDTQKINKLYGEYSRQDLSRMVFDGLVGRERLGGTGMGGGIALPHGRFDFIDVAVIGIFVAEPAIDMDAIDRKPVNVSAVMLVPDHYTDEDLRIMAAISELLYFGHKLPKLWVKFTESITSIEMKSCLTTIIQELQGDCYGSSEA
jgi:mannitol/fructose-specific phosphotransferase system IIA component